MNLFKISRAAVLVLAIVASPSPMAQSRGVVTVGRTAPFDNCTVDSLEEALKKAKTADYDDVIWISKDLDDDFFPDGTIEIKDQDVEIIGGFEDCNGFTGPSGYQVLSGENGDTESVIRIRGTSHVILRHLEISGGDEGYADEGGGIDFKGNGSLTLNHVRVSNNEAGYGGGMFVSGGTAGTPLKLVLDGDVAITDNIARRDGGGVHVTGFVDVEMRGAEVALHRNEARGINVGGVIEGGYGGGLYMKRPARVKVTASGFRRPPNPEPYPTFWMNIARYGGGIAAMGQFDNNIRASNLLMRDSVLEWNRALEEGGAIYFGTYLGFHGDSSSFCGRSVSFNGNAAPRGAAVFASADGNQAGFRIDDICLASNEFTCSGIGNCGQFVGNRTETEGGERKDGAIIEFPGQSGQIAFSKVAISENVASAAISMGSNAINRLSLSNCLIVDNDLSRYVVDTQAAHVDIKQCTIAGNLLGGSHVLRVVESDDDLRDVSITNSIVYQPGVSTLLHSGPMSQSYLRYLMTHSTLGLPVDNTIFAGDPQFSHAQTRYGLSPGSKAVDYAPSGDGMDKDRRGRDRTVDQPLDHNEYGPRDLGAHELELYGALVFKHGFE